MARGVKKINLSAGVVYYPKMSVAGQRVTIEPDQWAWFEVTEWEAGTTMEDKKKSITWLRQEQMKNYH